MTPTQRSLAHLRSLGYLAAVVERWNPHARIRQDLFGCIDILAVRKGETMAVQTTTSGVSERIAKIKASEAFATLLDAGWNVCVHGWTKRGARGKRKVWTLREVVLTREAGA